MRGTEGSRIEDGGGPSDSYSANDGPTLSLQSIFLLLAKEFADSRNCRPCQPASAIAVGHSIESSDPVQESKSVRIKS